MLKKQAYALGNLRKRGWICLLAVMAMTVPMQSSHASGENINIALGDLPPGKSVSVVFDATVDAAALAAGSVSQQGTVSGGNFADVLTDDPDAGGATDVTTTGIVNAEIGFNCGGTLVLNEGDGGTQTISAGDADGTVVQFALDSVSPMPSAGTILLGNFTAEADPAPAMSDVVVSSDVPAGTYLLGIIARNGDTPTAQTASCTLVIDIKGEPGFAVSVLDPIDVDNESDGPGSTVLFSTYAGRATQANVVSSQNFTDNFLGGYETHAADDFTIPSTDKLWRIRTVNLNGAYHNNSIATPGPADSVNVYILGNAGGQPDTTNLSAGAIYAAENIGYIDAGYGDFTIALPGTGLSLSPGTYWLVIQVNMNLAQGGQWSWTESSATPDTGTGVGAESVWFQSNGTLVADGCVGTWGARITDCGVTNTADATAVEPDLLFSLVGESAAPGVAVSPLSLSTNENGSNAAFEIVLTAPPSAGETVTVPYSSNDFTEGAVSGSVVFSVANWDIPQTVTVSPGSSGDGNDGDVAYSIDLGPTSSGDTDYDNLAVSSVTVTNFNVDGVTTVLLEPMQGIETTEAGGTATFVVKAGDDIVPSADVSIDLSPSPTSEVLLSTDGSTQQSAVTAVLTAGNGYSTTITVHGQDDDVVDGDAPFTIVSAAAVSSDLGFSGFNPADVAGINLDADFAGIANVSASGAVTEAGGAAILGFTLLSEPAADVTVPVFSTDTSEGVADVSSLTFTAANWDTPQAVTVTGQPDDLLDGDVFFALHTGPTLSADPVYNGVPGPAVPLTGVDDDGGLDTSTTVVSSSMNPANPGDPVTLTATVVPGTAGPDVPFGLVEVFDGASSLGIFTTNSAGAVQVTTSSLSEGDHDITAVYAGGPQHGTSTSPVFVQTIAPLAFVVDSLADDNDGDLSLGDIELREAIDAVGIGGTITFAPGLAGSTIQLDAAEGPLLIGKPVTITGLGANQLNVQGDGTNCVLVVGPSIDVAISGLAIGGGGGVGGLDDNFGGAISVDGVLTLSECVVGTSQATSGGGAIIVNGSGSLDLRYSRIVSSTTSGFGGAIFNQGSTLIQSSLIVDNESAAGGGIGNFGTLVVINSTISNNQSADFGAGIRNELSGEVTVVNCTITNNTAGNTGGAFGGGGVGQNGTGAFTIRNSIIAGNFGGNSAPNDAFQPDVRGDFTGDANNLIGDAAGATGFGASDILLTDTFVTDISDVLLPLADNGGPTETHALAIGSPAVNAGDDALALDDLSNPLATDQRGAGFPRFESTAVDIGAFELTPETDAPSVTIEQNNAEPDPTNTVPFAFDIVFSESVGNLDVADVSIGGTATGVAANVTRTGLATFTLQVTSVTGDGTVVPTVDAAAVADAFGNTSTASTSTDNSITYDATAPVITLTGDVDPFIECGDSYTDEGATASDNIDGDLTPSIVAGGDTVDTAQPQVYTITYDVTDAAGNAATQVTRAVDVSDNIAPTLTIVGGQNIFVECGSPYTPPTVTASDACAGDLTSAIVVSGDSVDTSTPGFYTVNYEVFDNGGNGANDSVQVEVADGTPPVITLTGAASVALECGDPYTEQGALVGDACGQANPLVIGGDTVDTSTPGVYVVTYNADDAAGNVAIERTRTVEVTDAVAPVITLNGAASVTLECKESYTELGATLTEACDSSAAVTIGGDTVDPFTPGGYVVTYNASDASGNAAAEVTRTVTVSAGPGCAGVYEPDQNNNGIVEFNELLRVVQFFSAKEHHCDATTEDGYGPGPGDQSCAPYDVDYNPTDWRISLSELLRVIQFYAVGGYSYCPAMGTEDGYCPGT